MTCTWPIFRIWGLNLRNKTIFRFRFITVDDCGKLVIDEKTKYEQHGTR